MVAQASTGREALPALPRASSGCDADGPAAADISGIDATIAIRSEFPDARIVMLTTFEGDVEIQRALAAGARGYVLKNMPPNELSTSSGRSTPARTDSAGDCGPTGRAPHRRGADAREIDVLRHVAGGNRNRDIAEKLFISEETVKVHVKHIMEKLGASDRTAAVAIGVRRGIIQL